MSKDNILGAKALFDQLKEEGNSYFQQEMYSEALDKYLQALNHDCNAVKERTALIRANCALACLKLRMYSDAYTHSMEWVKLDPKNDKAYMNRAEVQALCLQSIGSHTTLPNITYKNVIADYCQAHELMTNSTAIVEAIIVAIDEGHSDMVRHIKEMPPDFCNKVFIELLPRHECKQAHLEFLITEMWNEKVIDVSKVTFKQLITEKCITSASLFQHFLKLGLPLNKDDIKMAIDCLQLNQLHVPPNHVKELLVHTLRTNDCCRASSLARKFTRTCLEGVDLTSLMKSDVLNHPKLIEVLIDGGVNPNSCDRDGSSPIAIAMDRCLTWTKKIELICLLLNKGEHCSHLSHTGGIKSCTTPLHVATEVALKSGDLRLINSVIQSSSFDKQNVTNDKGESPLHLAIKSHWSREHSTTVFSALLRTGVLDPSHRDNSRRRPLDYLREPDERITILKDVMSNLNPDKRMESKKFKKSSKDTSKITKSQPKSPQLNAAMKVGGKQMGEGSKIKQAEVRLSVTPVEVESTKKSEGDFEQNRSQGSSQQVEKAPVTKQEHTRKIQVKDRYKDLLSKLDKYMKRLMSKKQQYFQAEEAATSLEDGTLRMREPAPLEAKKERVNTLTKERTDENKVGKKQDINPLEDMTGIFAEYVDGSDLDDLLWEVELTAKVMKFFKDRKKTPFEVRKAAANTIYWLADGKKNKRLSKLVSCKELTSVQLYEAKMTKAARILWEKAISYSARLTGTACTSTPVYTEVIRVLEIVLDHDRLNERIKYCTEQIKKSYQCGFRLPLVPQKASEIKEMEKVRGREKPDIPMTFLLQTGSEKKQSDYQFTPAVSSKGDTYSLTTLYSLDASTFKSMLLGTNDRRDFPFKEWHKEHEIIQLPYTEAILLLGRSGTGKTTSCLYRLWNELKIFWNPSSTTFGSKIPRRQLTSSAIVLQFQNDAATKNSETETDKRSVGTPLLSVGDSLASLNCAGQEISSPELGEGTEVVKENLHQVFITKNYVLCGQMRKHFYNMAAACDFLDNHLQFETTSIATDLSKVDDCAFPLFLTARQFYILLDNSLSDGKTFFKRDKVGNLMVKIASLDYDHEDQDILLDLEQSDSEDEEEDESVSTAAQSTFKDHTEQWTEVTALYFKEFIWPSISHQCGISSRDFIDPLLVWIEIQSFIKGSESALRKGIPLDLEEYKQIGNQMAPNFSDQRDTIYKIFLKYQKYKQNQRHHNKLFDECDLVLHLYNRLKDLRGVPWSIHSLYIDEVQDFTQAELAVLIHCCCDPNSTFFTGDTAQSIMRGVAFRFQDLRSIFHRIHSKDPVIKVPQKPYSLTINFRSHSGILKLAGSIIDLISEFFTDSIDHLPDDEGMFPGPTPVALEACDVDDLALLLSSNKREQSAIDFGAHQVILVQSKQAKDNLPSILKGAIVLTIFEAKGLEFDDVLLYNFFTDSIVGEKCWRVISSYLEMPQHRTKIIKQLPNCPRSQLFDPKLHKSLNSELKYLYTAITRAKCHLWIYDSDFERRHPMFDYWQRRDLVLSQVQVQPSMEILQWNIGFASKSTPEQWKAQGDNLMKRHLWEQAIQCYIRASPENEYLHLAKEANARHLIQQARHQKPQLYLEAALCFLEGDKLHHNLHYLDSAAICLKSSNPPRYLEAAKLFERLGRSEKAAQFYLKGKDIENYARLKESMGQHIKIIRTLMKIQRKRDALIKASEYEKQGIILPEDLSASELCYSLANFYTKMGDKKTLVEVLSFMPEVDRKIKFLKEAGLYNEAFEILKLDKLKDAYRLASAQAGYRQNPSDCNKTWLKKGIRLAEESKDEATRASFIFQMAKMEYRMRQTDDYKHDKDREVADNLHTLFQCRDPLIQAQAFLLFGILTKESSFCDKAQKIYHTSRHRIGELEAFNQVMLLTNGDCRLDAQLLLNICHKAKEASDALRNASNVNKIVKESLSFYGLQKIGDYCYTPPSQDIWIEGHLIRSKTNNEYDSDGMLKLKVSDVRSELARHCHKFRESWLSYSELKLKLQHKQMAFSLQQQLWKKPHCLQREYSMAEVSAEALRNYLQAVVHLLELHSLREERSESDELISLLISIFTPEVYIYIPKRITNAHISIIRRSVYSHSKFRLLIKHTSRTMDSSHHLNVESWLKAWRASCISQPDMKLLFSILHDLEEKVNDKYCKRGERPPDDEIPPGFIFWKNDKKLRHIFSFWLNSCVEIREKGRFIWASKLVIYRFLGTIAKSFNQYLIRVMSIVDILSIYCTGLLAMLTHMGFTKNIQRSITIPHSYKYRVQLFNLMISWREEDFSVFSACTNELNSLKNKHECYDILIGALEYLVGTSPYVRHFSLLSFSLENSKIISTDAAKQCLILALILFGNLSMLNYNHKMTEFYQKMLMLLQDAMSVHRESTPGYIKMAYEAIRTSNSPMDIFNLVTRLLCDAKIDSTLAWLIMTKQHRNGKVEIKPIHSSTQRQVSSPQTSVSYVPPPPGFTPSLKGSTGLVQNSSSSVHHPLVGQELQHDTPEWDQVQIHSKHFQLQEEEEDMALTCGAMGQWLQIKPELTDPDIVTHTFCNVCGMHLKADHLFSGIEELGSEADDTMSSELYDEHVFSVSHESNIFLYKRLTAILSNENGSEIYANLRRELTTLLQDIQKHQSKYSTDKLNRCIDDIEEELERNDRVLSELQESYSWRKANEEITGMTESMDRLMKKGKEVYNEVRACHREFEAKREDSEDDTAMDPQESIERELDYFSEQYETVQYQPADEKIEECHKVKT